MPTIDADAHVIETGETWGYMDESEARFRPAIVSPHNDGRHFWLIDGRIYSRKGNINKNIPEAYVEMRDIEGRLRHMDELGITIQVLYPSLFLRPLTKRAEIELALCKSYNRWLANIWRKGENRLRWVAVPPLSNMEWAIAEARFAKDNGACGLFMRGLVGDKILSDPYFFPFYEEASKLRLPICIHASQGNFDWVELFQHEGGFAKFKVPVLSAFHSIVHDGIPHRFPHLKFAFVEVSAQWVPDLIVELARRFKKLGKCLSSHLMGECRLYVACQTDDDLPYILKYVDKENIIIGTDYGHADTSSEIEALRGLRLHSGLSTAGIEKILYHNPRALYNL